MAGVYSTILVRTAITVGLEDIRCYGSTPYIPSASVPVLFLFIFYPNISVSSFGIWANDDKVLRPSIKN